MDIALLALLTGLASGVGTLTGFGFLLVQGRFQVPETTTTTVTVGALYGFSAGLFGIAGAERGAFLGLVAPQLQVVP